MTEKIEVAKLYFRQAHDSVGQRRNYVDAPYWIHTENVADLVWKFTKDEDLTIAALGHDVLEDVAPKNPEYSMRKISEKFGSVITNLIEEVTNVFTKEKYPFYLKEDRIRMEHERLGKVSNKAKTIKLADIVNNCSGILEQNYEFGRDYIKEKNKLLIFLRGGNDGLFKLAVQTIEREILKLKEYET